MIKIKISNKAKIGRWKKEINLETKSVMNKKSNLANY